MIFSIFINSWAYGIRHDLFEIVFSADLGVHNRSVVADIKAEVVTSYNHHPYCCLT